MGIAGPFRWRLRGRPGTPFVRFVYGLQHPLFGALGIAYAGLGLAEEAIREGKRGVDLLPVSKEAWRGLYRVEELALILTMTGRYDAAIDRIEFLLSVPGDMSVARLRLDPRWDPLRSHPRFQTLLEKYSKD